MSNLTGLSALVQGVQQGYTFVDDAMRKNKQDQREEETHQFEQEHRAQQKRQWSKAEEYDAAVRQLGVKYGLLDADQNGVSDAQQRPPADGVAPPANVVPEGANGTQTGAVTPPDGIQQTPLAAPAAAGVAPPISTSGGWNAINASNKATQPARNAEQLAVLQAELQNEQDPANRAALQREIARFGGPAEVSQVGGAAQPVATSQPVAGAQPVAAQGVGLTAAAQKDRYNNLNNTLNYALDRARLDIAFGKGDGQGLATLMKTVDGFRKEKMNETVALMNQGRYDEAVETFNSAGDHKNMRIVSAQDGQFTIGKTTVPTKIVTIMDQNGITRTINTAQTLYQQQDMAKLLESAQKERKLDIEQTEAEAKGKYYDAAAKSTKNQSLAGQIAEKEQILGHALTEDEKMTAIGVDKLPQAVRTQVNALLKEQENTQKAIDKAQAEGTWQPDSAGAKDIQTRQAKASLKLNRLLAPYQPKGKDAKGDTVTDPFGINGDDDKPKPPAAKGVKPAGTKPDTPKAPEYTAPPDSPAGKFQSRVAQAKADTDAAAKKVQTSFAADVSALKPDELLKKYNDQRGQLTPAQLIQLHKVEQKI